MKEIRLKGARFPILVDDDIFEEVKKHTWIVTADGVVAERFEHKNLLNIITGIKDNEWAYFLDGDKSNYQRNNLEVIPIGISPNDDILLKSIWTHAKKGTGNSIIYFIGCDENDNVKIGITKKPIQRKRELQAGSPVRLHIRAAINNQTHNDEARIHRVFREQRLWGEWFVINDKIQELIDGFKVEEVYSNGGSKDMRKGHMVLKRRFD